MATGDLGIARDGTPKPEFQRGMELRAKYTLFGEGCRGSLAQELMARFNLRDGVDPQKYGIGIKELWQVDPAQHRPGLVLHSQGWPLDSQTGGGSFVYHFGDNLVSVGFVIHLNYAESEPLAVRRVPAVQDASGDPPHLRGRQAARLRRARDQRRRPAVGAAAGVSRRRADRLLGRLRQPAADQGFAQRDEDRHARGGERAARRSAPAASTTCSPTIPRRIRRSWVYEDLHKVRNVKPGLKWGMWAGTVHGGLHMWLNDLGLGRLVGWTLRHGKADHEETEPAAAMPPIAYPKPDGVVSFDKLSSVFLSNTSHEEDQPVHLQLRDTRVPVAVNLAVYGGPEQRYCPAGVYEYVADEATGGAAQRLQINAANCVHCKTCDIKDPRQNIHWVTPEGGGGPNYPNM